MDFTIDRHDSTVTLLPINLFGGNLANGTDLVNLVLASEPFWNEVDSL